MARRYTFDLVSQRYRDDAGRFVSATLPQVELTKSLASAGAISDRLIDRLRSGALSLDAWRVEMQTLIKHTMLGSAAVAHGGVDALTDADLRAVEESITEQYLFLEAWTGEMADGDAVPDAGRARLYLEAGRVHYHAERHAAVSEAGFDEVRSILHPAEHCDLCVIQDALGWQSVDDFVPIGSRTCRAHDRCTVEYRKTASARSASTKPESQSEARARAAAALDRVSARPVRRLRSA